MSNENVVKQQNKHGGKRTGSGRKPANLLDKLRVKTWWRAALKEAGWDGKDELTHYAQAKIVSDYVNNNEIGEIEFSSKQVKRIYESGTVPEFTNLIAVYDFTIGIGDTSYSIWKAISGNLNTELKDGIMLPNPDRDDVVFQLCIAINEYVNNNAINPDSNISITTGREIGIEKRLHESIYNARNVLKQACISKHELLNAVREQCCMKTTQAIKKQAQQVQKIREQFAGFCVTISDDDVPTGDYSYSPEFG